MAEVDPIRDAANKIAASEDADVILYNGDIEEPWDERLAASCGSVTRRTNVLLIPVTYGGDPHGAYRIARCLESLYDRFAAFVPGPCKSAGTLLVTGANELVISDLGELGPLDIQMRKADELWEMNSGLTVMEAMSALSIDSYNMFERYFLTIMASSGGRISFRTATQVASEVVVGLMKPLYAQIDPMMIGEASRAIQIADDYAQRLNRFSKNVHEEQLADLVNGFSSHGFVIDRTEAERFFVNVRAPNEAEHELEMALREAGLMTPNALTEGEPIAFLSDSVEDAKEVSDDGTQNGGDRSSGTKGEARASARSSKGTTNGGK